MQRIKLAMVTTEVRENLNTMNGSRDGQARITETRTIKVAEMIKLKTLSQSKEGKARHLSKKGPEMIKLLTEIKKLTKSTATIKPPTRSTRITETLRRTAASNYTKRGTKKWPSGVNMTALMILKITSVKKSLIRNQIFKLIIRATNRRTINLEITTTGTDAVIGTPRVTSVTTSAVTENVLVQKKGRIKSNALEIILKLTHMTVVITKKLAITANKLRAKLKMPIFQMK